MLGYMKANTWHYYMQSYSGQLKMNGVTVEVYGKFPKNYSAIKGLIGYLERV